MTAIAGRRRRTTVVAAVVAAVLVVVASVMGVVGVVTLANSREGEAVGVDDRPRETFPATPNALLAVTDDSGQLASLVVLTLLPSGQGGSIVTVPVNADSTAGFGAQRRPLDQSWAADDVEELVAGVEEMLSIVIQRAAIVGPDQLAQLLTPIESLEVVLPENVVDSDAVDDGITDASGEDDGVVAGAGPQALTTSQIVDVLTAVNDEGDAYDHHDIDVEMWAAIARTAPLTDAVPAGTTPADGTTPAQGSVPGSVQGLIDQLWQGEVGVRDITTVELVGDNPTDEDVVVLDVRDATLVFAQISPGLVSSASTGMRIRVVAPFTDEQLEAAGYESVSEVLLGFIGEMMFVQAGVVSIDSQPAGAAEVTVIDAAQETGLEQIESGVEALFGPSEVRLAETVIDGVDLVVTLGTGYLDRRGPATDASDTTVATRQDGTLATVAPDDITGGTVDDG